MASPPKPRGTADAARALAQSPQWQVQHRWPPELREEFEERAAIMEFEGNLTREDAETKAFELLKGRAKP